MNAGAIVYDDRKTVSGVGEEGGDEGGVGGGDELEDEGLAGFG
jgi:hypothetical protein